MNLYVIFTWKSRSSPSVLIVSIELAQAEYIKRAFNPRVCLNGLFSV